MQAFRFKIFCAVSRRSKNIVKRFSVSVARICFLDVNGGFHCPIVSSAFFERRSVSVITAFPPQSAIKRDSAAACGRIRAAGILQYWYFIFKCDGVPHRGDRYQQGRASSAATMRMVSASFINGSDLLFIWY